MHLNPLDNAHRWKFNWNIGCIYQEQIFKQYLHSIVFKSLSYMQIIVKVSNTAFKFDPNPYTLRLWTQSNP